MAANESEVTINKALASLRNAFGESPPDLALILGSGLGEFADGLESAKRLTYERIEGFPPVTVPGHQGTALLGRVGKKNVLIFRGRFHYYEGHSLPIATLPVRVAGAWGIKTLVVSNAAGSIRKEWKPGSLALISDHINGIGANPLRGPNQDELGPRFFDLSNAYDPIFRSQLKRIAKRLKIKLSEGVYIALPGPSYETPAEIRMLTKWGADLVGMSTVPEVIVARHQGMRVLGISCITNWAAGVKGAKAKPISHEEVMEETARARKDFARLLTRWINEYE